MRTKGADERMNIGGACCLQRSSVIALATVGVGANNKRNGISGLSCTAGLEGNHDNADPAGAIRGQRELQEDNQGVGGLAAGCVGDTRQSVGESSSVKGNGS